MKKIAKKVVLPVMALGLTLSLMACKESKEYKIIFEANNGSDITESTDNVLQEPVPIKEGYTFEGWYKASDFTGEKVTFPLEINDKEDITLYAKWKAIEYNLIYHLDEGISADNPSVYTIEDTIVLKAPVKEGYTFEGWYSDSEYTNKITEITKGTFGNKDLYAKWTENTTPQPIEKYSVTYEINGHGVQPEAVSDVTALPATLPVLVEEGWTFGGWYTDSACTTVAEAGTAITANTTLYAKWTENVVPEVKYSVTYVINGHGTQPEGLSEVTALPTALPQLTEEGWTFEGWYTDELCTTAAEAGTAITANTTLYAKWTENVVPEVKYSVTYVINGHGTQPEVVSDVTALPTALPQLTEAGWTFDGWYTDELCTISAEAGATIHENTVLYAKWELAEYTITYHLYEGINAVSNPNTYTIEDIVVLANATKTNYIFDGWYTEETFGEASKTVFLQHSTGNLDLYAKFIPDYSLLYGVWSNDGYTPLLEITENTVIYDEKTAEYTKDDYNLSATVAGKDLKITYVGNTNSINLEIWGLKNEEALEKEKLNEYVLSKLQIADTSLYAGTYYTGTNRTSTTLVLDSRGYIKVLDGNSSLYRGSYTVENAVITLTYRLQGPTVSPTDTVLTGTIENGVITLNKDDKVQIYVKDFAPEVYYASTGDTLYVFGDTCVLEQNGNDALAQVEGEFTENAVLTVNTADTVKSYKITRMPTDTNWGTLDLPGQHAGTYTVSQTEDIVILDGFGPTNGMVGTALYNDMEIQYAIPKYNENMLLIIDGVEKYYSLDAPAKVLTEITEKDFMEGVYTSGSSSYKISGLGYYIKSNSSYYGVYTLEENTIRINNTVYTIYHSGNVMQYNNTTYVKEGYTVENKDFTEYLDKTYVNEENGVKLAITAEIAEDSIAYKVKIEKAFTVNDIDFSVGTYDAVYVLDRLVFENVELILTDRLSLSVGSYEYELTEFIPEKTLAEKAVGLYVYSNYYVSIFAENDALKVYYGSSINPYSDPTAYECTIISEEEGTMQFLYSSYVNAFTFTETEGVKKITFDSATTVEYSYRGKEFTLYDDSTVELVGKNYESKAGTSPSASTVAEIRENGTSQSWSNIKYVTALTDTQKNVPGTYEVEVYAWVYGKKITATVSYTVVESYTLSYSSKTIYVQEGYGKAEIIASGMFTAKHNGVIDVITEEMITLPDNYDSMTAGVYEISCTYYTETVKVNLTVNPDPTGHYSYVSGETNTSYGTYFSSGFDIEVVNGKVNLIINSTTITDIKSGNDYTIVSKEITVKILTDGQVTLTYTDTRWNEYTTTYAKPKEIDLTKYLGVYTNGNYYVRLFSSDKTLKVYYGSSINPYSDPTAYECTIISEEEGTMQFLYSSYVNAFTFTETEGVKKITFDSATTVEYSYRGKEFTLYDDSTVELVGKNYESKAGTSPSASTVAEIRENGTSQSWSNIKYVTALTDTQKNVPGTYEVEVYAWVYGKKITATVSYTVVESYTLSYSSKTIYVQEGYGKAEIIASGMFTAKHNGVIDVITEEMITLPDNYDSMTAGVYEISCTYYTETVKANLTVQENPAGTYAYSGGNTTYANYGIYFQNGFELTDNGDGTFTLTSGSTVYSSITLGKYYENPSYKGMYINVIDGGIQIYEENYNYYCTYTKQA